MVQAKTNNKINERLMLRARNSNEIHEGVMITSDDGSD